MARRIKFDGKKWQGVSWWGELTNVQHNIMYNKPLPKPTSLTSALLTIITQVLIFSSVLIYSRLPVTLSYEVQSNKIINLS